MSDTAIVGTVCGEHAHEAYLEKTCAWCRIRELEVENARLNMEMVAYRKKLTPQDAAAMVSIINALYVEKTERRECQHDLLMPRVTVEIDADGIAQCHACGQVWHPPM